MLVAGIEVRDILGYPGYLISKEGNIWSKISGRFLSPSLHIGYPCVNIKGEKGYRPTFIHTLLLSTFVGPCPPGMECRHLDGNPRNNKLSNLRWGTRQENMKDKIKHGTNVAPKGVCHSKVKLSETDVRLIVYQMKTGLFTQREIATIYGVDHSTINNITHQKIWKHLWAGAN